MNILAKKTFVFLGFSSLMVYGSAKLLFDIDDPFEIYRYLNHLSYRRWLEEKLFYLKSEKYLSTSSKNPNPWYTSEGKRESDQKQMLMERIKDHTVKIVRNCTSLTQRRTASGTGWFLDHEIREDGGYPLKWFLATNAHVIADHTFGDNPYGQILPVEEPRSWSSDHCHYDGLHLYKWESGGWDEEMFRKNNVDSEDPEVWSDADLRNIFEADEHQKTYSKNVNYGSKRWNRKSDIPLMHVHIRDPKLFYVPLNFLSGESNDHYKDFAILEINFENERSARRMTEKIYGKSEEKRINFLSEVRSDKLEYFSAGYPGNSFNGYRAFGNYSPTKGSGSTLTSCVKVSVKSGEEFVWAGKKYEPTGCYYHLSKLMMGKGSSGSMVVDDSGNLLGLHTLGSDDNREGYVGPIRNKINCPVSGIPCASSMEYDLIAGSPNQKTSYKQQLLSHLPNVNTYLKNKNKWGVK